MQETEQTSTEKEAAEARKKGPASASGAVPSSTDSLHDPPLKPGVAYIAVMTLGIPGLGFVLGQAGWTQNFSHRESILTSRALACCRWKVFKRFPTRVQISFDLENVSCDFSLDQKTCKPRDYFASSPNAAKKTCKYLQVQALFLLLRDSRDEFWGFWLQHQPSLCPRTRPITHGKSCK